MPLRVPFCCSLIRPASSTVWPLAIEIELFTRRSDTVGVREAAGVNIVLNARVDAFLRQAHGDAPPIEEAIRRGRMYLEAGADCVFPIGAPDEGTIAALVDGIPGPMNAIASFRGAPGLRRLSAMGVRRISYAGRLQHAALDEHRRRLSAIASGDDI